MNARRNYNYERLNAQENVLSGKEKQQQKNSVRF